MRIRSRGAFRNPSLYAEKTESRSNSCKGFFAEHLSELMLAFSSHLSNSSGLYPYISAYLRFFINLVIIKKAGWALKGASPGQARQSLPGGNTARRILPFRGWHVMCAATLKRHFIPHRLLIFLPLPRILSLSKQHCPDLNFFCRSEQINDNYLDRICCWRLWVCYGSPDFCRNGRGRIHKDDI